MKCFSCRGGFCDTCFQFCRQESEEAEDQETPAGQKKRHMSEQSGRGKREGLPEPEPVKPLVKDDSHMASLRSGSGSRRGSLVTSGPQEVPVAMSQCGCWCQGWCELLVRRPSGVTSWVCRIQVR